MALGQKFQTLGSTIVAKIWYEVVPFLDTQLLEPHFLIVPFVCSMSCLFHFLFGESAFPMSHTLIFRSKAGYAKPGLG